MKSNPQDSSSPSHYEREAERTRYRLANSLDELSDRLTPGQVFDEMLTYAKGGGGTFLRALSTASRENPIPSLLIGAGCMMFLSEKMGFNRYLARRDGNGTDEMEASSSGMASRVGEAASHATDATRSSARSAADTMRSGVRRTRDFASEKASDAVEGAKRGAAAVGEAVSSAGETIRRSAHDLGDQMSSAAGQARQSAQDVADTIQEYSASIGDQVADAAESTRTQATRAARKTKDATAAFINEQPLLCAAIGLAVGAAIAAMLPSTETENELMGKTSDAVKDAVGEAALEQFETAKDAAGKVVQEAKSAAEREGLTSSGAADMARNVGEKLKRVVTDTGAAAGDEMRDLVKGEKLT